MTWDDELDSRERRASATGAPSSHVTVLSTVVTTLLTGTVVLFGVYAPLSSGYPIPSDSPADVLVQWMAVLGFLGVITIVRTFFAGRGAVWMMGITGGTAVLAVLRLGQYASSPVGHGAGGYPLFLVVLVVLAVTVLLAAALEFARTRITKF